MELWAVLLMIAAGGVAAVCVLGAERRDERRRQAAASKVPAGADEIAAALIHRVLTAGGLDDAEAARRLRSAGIRARVVTGVDLVTWGESYARIVSRAERERLLDDAVRLAAGRSTLPLRQFVALLDLAFALGFRMDALARLRERYGFDYVDHAKDARPREADPAGAMSLYLRDDRERLECLGVLGIEGTPTRQTIIAAYRRLAALHHPDRFHAETEETVERKTREFIAITSAYERLLDFYSD